MRIVLVPLTLAALLAACAPPRPAEPPAVVAPDTVSSDESLDWSDAPWEEARRRGVTFRAVGNEPGWHVEVWADSLVFTTLYGEEVYRFHEVTTSLDGAESLVYRASAEGNAITVTRSSTPCVDDMSGQPFEATATVAFDGHSYQGCGRVLD